MAITVNGVTGFFSSLVDLQSFPLFCAYMLMILLSSLWQRIAPPLSLRPILVVFNFVCSAVSGYTMIGFTYGVLNCTHIYSMESDSNLRSTFWIYWLTKNFELLDTVWMILRHKNRQISFLHIYHHGSMLLLSDYAYQYTPWAPIAFFLAMNSFVHVVLYYYYGMAALNPQNPPSWKKRLTELQILQFAIGCCFSTCGYLYHGFCIYSIFYGITMAGLFSNFYYQAYFRKRSSKKDA
ncbi:unnamed protein product [Owenia fusiformis]|uniref:Elongation of very long chain fatty acids protein n=1 Tax=Owenia fusiformis TaxID=6347 RepID=A0A8J1UL70_OWEFU|nr:unnamed protein product [Owenia fusiformis]